MSVETSNEEASFNNYADRCDRCGAQAQKKIVKDTSLLMFCNHHYNAHADALVLGGWSIVSRESELVDA